MAGLKLQKTSNDIKEKQGCEKWLLIHFYVWFTNILPDRLEVWSMFTNIDTASGSLSLSSTSSRSEWEPSHYLNSLCLNPFESAEMGILTKQITESLWPPGCQIGWAGQSARPTPGHHQAGPPDESRSWSFPWGLPDPCVTQASWQSGSPVERPLFYTR